MGEVMKMDQSAFNRGVDEIMLLKPLRRVISAVGIRNASGHAAKGEAKVKSRSLGDIVRNVHDKASK